jgi:hypothetical protein
MNIHISEDIQKIHTTPHAITLFFESYNLTLSMDEANMKYLVEAIQEPIQDKLGMAKDTIGEMYDEISELREQLVDYLR